MTVCALFSGGKDSSLAVLRAESGDVATGAVDGGVDALVSVAPEPASAMFHVPAVEVAGTVADATPYDHHAVEATTDDMAPLRRLLEELDASAVVTGAVASSYQRERVDALCETIGAEPVHPLWHDDPAAILRDAAETFDVVITGVAADGLDDEWLGATLTPDRVERLLALEDEYGVHPAGEGGEFETLVVDGPHMDRRLALEYDVDWDGIRGSLNVTSAELVDGDRDVGKTRRR